MRVKYVGRAGREQVKPKKPEPTGSWVEGMTRFFCEVSIEKPTPEKVAEWQREKSYAPEGYGGPYGIEYLRLDNGDWMTKWFCSNYSD